MPLLLLLLSSESKNSFHFRERVQQKKTIIKDTANLYVQILSIDSNRLFLNKCERTLYALRTQYDDGHVYQLDDHIHGVQTCFSR